jgi:hypothetical protein
MNIDEFSTRVDRIVADHGATMRGVARKRGRTAEWPYVAVIIHTTGGVRGDGYEEQILARAYNTAAEAVIAAEANIASRRYALRRDLFNPAKRAYREHHGLPRELPDGVPTS